MPSITELLCELGLARELVGRTGFCIHPQEVVQSIPKVGGTKSVNLKKIRELAPTHVVVNVDENKKETADALAEFVPQLIVTHPLGPLDNLALYRQIGSAFGKEREAELLCSRFDSELQKVKNRKYSSRNVIYLIWKDPWMTVSRDTYVSRMLALFGMHTIPESADTRYPKLRSLQIEGREQILLSTEPFRFDESHRKLLQEQEGIPAHLIDGEMTSWYGGRAIQAMRYLSDFASSH